MNIIDNSILAGQLRRDLSMMITYTQGSSSLNNFLFTVGAQIESYLNTQRDINISTFDVHFNEAYTDIMLNLNEEEYFLCAITNNILKDHIKQRLAVGKDPNIMYF